MKIGIFVPRFNAGGVETFILRLSSLMKKEGHEVTIVSTNDKGEWWDQLSTCKLNCDCLSRIDSFAPLTQIAKIAKYVGEKNFDILILNNDKYAQAALSLLPDKINAIPIIHSDAEFAYEIGCANSSAWNVIVGVSPKVCDVIKRKVPHRPVTEIPYCVEMPTEDMWRKRKNFNGHLELLFVGRIEHSQKGVLLLPDVLAGCLENGLDVSLTIVGDGSDLNRLRDKIGKFDLWHHVSFSGLLAPTKVYDVLLSHHILLLPSFFEGLSIISLESQACGCVPIASKLEGVTDRAIQDGSSGILVEPGNVDDMIKAIIDLHGSPEKWRAMSIQGHSRIEKMFSVESMGKAYLRLFYDVMGGRYALPSAGRKKYRVNLSLLSWKDFVPNYLRKIRRVIRRYRKIAQ